MSSTAAAGWSALRYPIVAMPPLVPAVVAAIAGVFAAKLIFFVGVIAIFPLVVDEEPFVGIRADDAHRVLGMSFGERCHGGPERVYGRAARQVQAVTANFQLPLREAAVRCFRGHSFDERPQLCGNLFVHYFAWMPNLHVVVAPSQIRHHRQIVAWRRRTA